MERELVKNFVGKFGQRYAETLGIDISSGKDEEIFKWFLASILFGAPITENAVFKTYRCFQKHGVLTPRSILQTGWNKLVEILDEGGYTRYDFKTADKLLEIMKNLIERYNGSLTLIHSESLGTQDLEKKLKELGKGIGDVTVSIFLRELRDLWEKADSKPTSLIIIAAKNLGIISENTAINEVLDQLKNFWNKNRIAGKSFINFETALLRLGKNFCRRKKCAICPVRNACLNPVAP